MRTPSSLAFVGSLAVACGSTRSPAGSAGNGYQEYDCPAPVGKIVREDCSRSALRYDGAQFSGSVGAGGVGASASYRDSAVREANDLVSMLKEQRVALCNNFNTCKLTVAEYRDEQKHIDDSFVALLAVKDKMAQMDAEGATKLLGEIRAIRTSTRKDASTCDDACSDSPGCDVTVARSFSNATGEHFYTTDHAEAKCCGFTVEKPAYFRLRPRQAPGLAPLHRCFWNEAAKHVYTAKTDCEGLKPEGVMGYMATSPVCGAVALHRFYAPHNNDHFYTTDFEEAAKVRSWGWKDEGVAGYVWPPR